MDDQKIKMELQWVGTEGAKVLRKSVADLQVQLALTAAEFAKGAITQEQFDTQTKKLTADLKPHEVALRNVEAATNKLAGSTEKATSKVAGFGQSALQTGRVVQDFAQGGLGGVLNNIEGLTMALGLGQGLAGVLTIAGVALLLFKDKLPAVGEALGLFKNTVDLTKDSIVLLEERIKVLEEKKVKLSVDTMELDAAKLKLDELKKDKAAFDALAERKSADEAAAGAGVKKLIDEGGPKRIKEVIRAQIQNELIANRTDLFTSDTDLVEQATRVGTAHAKANLMSPEETEKAISRQIAAYRERERTERLVIGARAGTMAGGLIRRAESGTDTAASEELAGRLVEGKMPELGEKISLSHAGETRKRRNLKAAREGFDEDAAADEAFWKPLLKRRKADKEFNEWVENRFLEIGQEFKEEADKKAAGVKKFQERREKVTKETTAEAVKLVSETTDIDEAGAEYAARLGAGEEGRVGPRGMIPMSPQRRAAQVSRAISKRIGDQLPPGAQRAAVVEEMTKTAMKEADETRSSTALAIGGRAVNATERAAEGMQINMAAIQALTARMDAAEAKMRGITVQALHDMQRLRADANKIDGGGK